ncbi:DUF1254 domain-containing protein [Streptomyces sp. HNM0574]|uniref:DUF1254 domain-containing protein n=1 Tax=Streptomyces sp. HNM0574 TaxID=2714954 RepID=UPI00146A6050|nr:DUF1254 domain-containing protein [Streptomyces sp. HNM0574]NLU68780.1 DUF1254 domain-containing protein [Streptomyces sp. HNM0574]
MTELHAARLSGDEKIETAFGTIELEHTFPTDDSAELLFDQLDTQRAAQAYLWSLPLVGFFTWRERAREVFGSTEFGDFVVYDSLREKRGIVTANLTTPYVINFTSLADGPVLIDHPAGPTAGGVLDFWQRPVVDLGQTGPDAGKGGGYVVLGPEHDAQPYEDSGRHVVRSATVNVFIAFRLLTKDPELATAAKEGLKLSRAGSDPAPVRFIEGVDREWSATPARGLAYWSDLAAALQEEPVREIDKAFMAMLAPLGIAKGQRFEPDDRQRRILEEGAALGELLVRNLQVNPRCRKPYWEHTSWYKSFDFEIEQQNDTMLQLDQRATWFYEAVSSTKGMVHPTLAAGQVFMTAKRDSDGRLLRADRSYHLHIPADVPAAQFWSLTLYSEDTRRPYDNGGTEIRSVSLDSVDEQLEYNDDGSIDLYVGPSAPAAAESNWMKTVGQDGWFVYFRLYAPTAPFFDRSWSLPDFRSHSAGSAGAEFSASAGC